MAHAYANLMENEVYTSLKATITGEIIFKEGNFHFTTPTTLQMQMHAYIAMELNLKYAKNDRN